MTDSKDVVGEESGLLRAREEDGDEAVCATISAGCRKIGAPAVERFQLLRYQLASGIRKVIAIVGPHKSRAAKFSSLILLLAAGIWSIWQNVSEKAPFFATTFSRPFKDQSGQWRNFIRGQ